MANQTEKETRREIARNEASTIIEINKILDAMCLSIFALPLVKVYISRGTASPISDTASLIALSKSIDKVIAGTMSQIDAAMHNGVVNSWVLGEKLGYTSLIGKVPPNVLETLKVAGTFAHREKAATAFINRATKGLNLSGRVWQMEAGIKTQIESTLQLAVHEGRSAAQVATDLKQYLKNPDKLFRRVRDAEGNLQLSKAAQDYHPGTGVYRSSYQNAFRLIRNETNNAYRRADWEQMQSMDFVTGQRIEISNNHLVPDICDDLQGDYPKSFLWSGWHVACRCHMIKVIIGMDDFVQKLQGTFTPKQITDMPENFNNWVETNTERIQNANSVPYFIQDNFVKGDITKGLNFGAIQK